MWPDVFSVRLFYSGLVWNVTTTHPGLPTQRGPEVKVHFLLHVFLNFWSNVLAKQKKHSTHVNKFLLWRQSRTGHRHSVVQHGHF